MRCIGVINPDSGGKTATHFMPLRHFPDARLQAFKKTGQQ